MLKSATIKTNSSPFVQNGTAYTYIDSSSTNLTFYNRDITSPSSPLGRTLAGVYKGADLSFMYNDETPSGKTSSSYGHTKGVIGATGNEGFWLIHSVPSFPPPPEQGYSYPPNGRVYGQSFLCLSLGMTVLQLFFYAFILFIFRFQQFE